MKEFSWPIRVYYEDTDAGGVVFYANYLRFFERARTELLRSFGFEQDQLIAEENIIFVVRSVTVDYLKPKLRNNSVALTNKSKSAPALLKPKKPALFLNKPLLASKMCYVTEQYA